MNAPQLLPMLKPFAQAVAYQRERVPMTAKKFATLSNEAKLRSFTIAGLTRKALLDEAHKAATRALEEGLTRDEFLDQLGEVLDKQDGLLLSPRRLELIAQNNLAVAYSAGRFVEMSDPDLVAARPYRQYPLGPHDNSTSTICLKLEGFVARWDDPVWDHIFPPNHHNERHLQVLTLTEEQAREIGVYVTPEGGDGYPHVDGQTILPDPGWDFRPGLLAGDDRALVEASTAAGRLWADKMPADYGLLEFSEIDAATLPAPPARTVDPISDVNDLAQYERARAAFRVAVDLKDGEERTIILDPFGDGHPVSEQLFEHMVGLDGDESERKRKADRPRHFEFLRPTIEDPFEVWWTINVRADQVPVISKRIFGLYQGDEGAIVFFDVNGYGLVEQSGFVTEAKKLERLRRGRLAFSKAKGKKR